VYNTLTAAANIYHANLTDDQYSFIFNQWGITRESVDDWNLGYASTERDLEGMDPKTLIKAGLVNITDTGNMGGEFYRGRIIFPYIIHGTIQYMTGRVTPDTPDHDKESKYKNLRIRYETKNEQISEFINKMGFFGEDRIKNTDICLITEGLADCIVANQFGFPCLALGSTGISKECQVYLIHLLSKKKNVSTYALIMTKIKQDRREL
jgi:DNA primase